MSGIALEQMLTSPNAFALTTATPLQRAICRIADGLPIDDLLALPLLEHPEAYPPEVAERCTWEWCIGDVSALPVGTMPTELYGVAGIRGGKSLLTAAAAAKASQTVDVSRLGAGEVPRTSIMSLSKDLGAVIYDHALGAITTKPALKSLLLGDPTTDAFRLRHPSGRAIETKVVAGARAGGTLVSRWSSGCILDEATRMVGAEEGVVNMSHSRQAVLGRLLPGAQFLAIGSPWAPFGPMYEAVVESWQRPTEQLVVIRAPAPALNPVHWTPELVAEVRAGDEMTYRTDILGDFADRESSLFNADLLEAATRSHGDDLRPEPGQYYVAAIDPATRGDTWTLVVLTRIPDDKHGSRLAVALCRSWRGTTGNPLSPDVVLAEIAGLLAPYRVPTLASDQWSGDAIVDLGRRHGLCILTEAVTAQSKVHQFEGLAALVATGRIELPRHPELLEDLRMVRRRVTQSGVRIELPRASGRHGDFAAALALAAAQHVAPPRQEPPKLLYGSPEWWAAEEKRWAEEEDALADPRTKTRRRMAPRGDRRARLRQRRHR